MRAVVAPYVSRDILTRLLWIAVAAFALATAARLAMPLPWTPVPLTAQTLVVLLIGALLGPVDGVLAVAMYLATGLAGAPAFTAGGGAGCLFGPTGGYLLGFLPAAWLAGSLMPRVAAGTGAAREAWHAVRIVIALLLAEVALFATGMAWLNMLLPGKALLAGLFPFLPGEIVKIGLATMVIRAARADH